MSCYKTSYESEGLALVAIDELINNGVKDANLLSTYKCDVCEYWHLTSTK